MIVLSYPRSGRTWLLRMLAEYLGCPIGNHKFTDEEQAKIRLGEFPGGDWVQGFHWAGPEELGRIRSVYQKKAVYLLRDPRDCLVSYYRFHVDHKGRGFWGRLRGHLRWRRPRTVRDILGQWKRHVADQRGLADGMIRYEDLLKDTFGTVRGLIGDGCDEARLRSAVQKFDFYSMTGRMPGEEDRSAFVRNARPGDWAGVYGRPRYRSIIKETVGEELVRFGYERNDGW